MALIIQIIIVRNFLVFFQYQVCIEHNLLPNPVNIVDVYRAVIPFSERSVALLKSHFHARFGNPARGQRYKTFYGHNLQRF